MILPQEFLKQLDLSQRHVHDLLHAAAERVESLQKTDFLGQIMDNGLLDAFIQKLGMGRPRKCVTASEGQSPISFPAKKYHRRSRSLAKPDHHLRKSITEEWKCEYRSSQASGLHGWGTEPGD